MDLPQPDVSCLVHSHSSNGQQKEVFFSAAFIQLINIYTLAKLGGVEAKVR